MAIDLTYGLPGQRPKGVADDLRRCADPGLDGVPLYSLHLIPGTPQLTAIEKGKIEPPRPPGWACNGPAPGCSSHITVFTA